METQKYQEKKEKFADEEEGRRGREAKSKQQSSPITINNPPSSPSPSSSPSHEFSFTISLHPTEKTKSQSSFAIDLSPADDIFFHGHLLPLHLLSHIPLSPRSSINSLDSFTLPIKDLLEDRKPNNQIQNSSNSSETKRKNKIKSFPLFGFAKWRKGYGRDEGYSDQEDKKKKKKKKKLRFDVTKILRRYVNMVRPLVFFRGGNNASHKFRKQCYSFSGNLSSIGKQDYRGRREGGYSAPVSMRTSPNNSGLLVPTVSLPSTRDSSIEELQSAIQAAIAHCKNSNAIKGRDSNSEISVG